MFMLMCVFLIFCKLSSSFEIQLPFNQRISYNTQTGVLRIGLKPKKIVPPDGTSVDPSILLSIQVRHSGNDIKGFGAFATSDIEKDVFIGFYEGKKITSRESLECIISQRRKVSKKNSDNAMNYIMNVDGGYTFIDGYERSVNFKGCNLRSILLEQFRLLIFLTLLLMYLSRAQDRTIFSTVHLNHAQKESPACNVIRLLEDDRIAFFTSRTVHAGEELCFDYGSNFWKGKELMKV